MKKAVRYAILVALAAMAFAVSGAAVHAQTRTFSTGFQIQNLSTTTANVTISFYPEGSGTALPPVSTTVAGSGSKTYATLPSAVTAGFTGAAVISADQKIAAIVNVVSPDLSLSFGGAAYSGFTSGAKTVSLPVIFKGSFGFNTFFNVQNVSSTAASVSVRYSNGVTEGPFTIQPGSAKRFDQAVNAGLTAPFFGSATVTSDQDIAATVIEVGPTTVLGYNGITAGSTAPVFPLVNSNNAGYMTGIGLQNAGDVATTVTVSYTPSGSGLGTACTETQTIPAKGTKAFAIDAFRISAAGENCANGALFVGSAKVTANSASQPLVGIVNQLNQTTNKGGSYNAFNTSNATNTVVYPLIQDRVYGFFTGISIVNVGDVATPLTCTYSGTTYTDSTASLAPGATFTVQQVNKIGNLFNGSGTCTASAPGAKIVGIANQLKNTGTTDTFFVYEGTNN